MDMEKFHWLMESLTPEQLEQMSSTEILQLFMSVVPIHYLIIFFCIASVLPALFTAISASIVNVPERGFFLSYLAVLSSGVLSTLMVIALNKFGVTHWLPEFITSSVAMIAAICFYFRATLGKASLVFIFSMIFQILTYIAFIFLFFE